MGDYNLSSGKKGVRQLRALGIPKQENMSENPKEPRSYQEARNGNWDDPQLYANHVEMEGLRRA